MNMVGHNHIAANRFSFLDEIIQVFVNAVVHFQFFIHAHPFVTGESDEVKTIRVFYFGFGGHSGKIKVTVLLFQRGVREKRNPAGTKYLI